MKPYLTFKGGTSLSKVYSLIDRFSEDIDLSIEREFFGFGEPHNPENAPSKKKTKQPFESLFQLCTTEMLANLKEIFTAELRTTHGWQIFSDPEGLDAQSLLFEYPSNTSKTGYIRPLVKIEIGARSEHWPVSEHKIESYVKEVLKEKIHEPDTVIRVLNVERTFWEKATILHQYAHLA